MTTVQCPCCDGNLHATETSHRLFDVLKRWEAHGVEFSAATWADYPSDHLLVLNVCPNCGFGVFLPMTTGTDSFYIDISRSEYYLPDRWDFHVALQSLRKSGAKSVLDIGCGRGAFLALVMNALPGISCHGTDANPAAGESAVDGIALHQQLLDAPENMDAVTLFQVVEHVADPAELLCRAISRVRRGGLVVVSVPDHTGPIRFFADSHTAVPPHHVTIWSPKSLESLLVKLGLTIVSRRWEPLPDYLMPFYLPKILSNLLGCIGDSAKEAKVKRYLAAPITRLCNRFKIRSLPIHGHTFLIVAQNGTAS